MTRFRTGLTVVTAAVLGLIAAAFITQWVVVDVRPSGRGAFKVPVPVTVLRAAVALVPDSAYGDAGVPRELAGHRASVLKALAALRASPDATFVTVRSEDAEVSVAKRGGLLLIKVRSNDDATTVHCRIPLRGLHQALDRWDWKTVDPGAFLAILGDAPRGPLVEVAAPEAIVNISIW